MRDIATAAEMQPASVYYYFESKEELLWAVLGEGRPRTFASGRRRHRHQNGSLATHGNRLHRAHQRPARLAARQPGAFHHAAVALPGEHQGKGHRAARRVREDLHRLD